ncbi:OsmC family protein [Sphingomonas lenta]|uniref:OsmC family peroxiredoxin n=1 Tax=Sphingomonas lenta TaxID=1141887 RepID=A0A2A2SD75_9SPHN|nr:OsmC family protein [Sphingomonas lenta]PAX07206.1 OsmC family peroxiredoxin [Sphingomonas lenta]
MPTRSATARYQGMGKEGQGYVSTQSGVLADSRYGFGTRFEDGPGTNPEELLAAAHASCFTMALAFQLAGAGFSDGTLDTECKVSLEKDGEGFTITKSALTLRAQVGGIERAQFDELARKAKENCPLSKVIDAEITLDATLA